MDLLISDWVPPTRTSPTKSPEPSTTVSTKPDLQDLSKRLSRPAPTQQPTAPLTTTQQTTTKTKPAPTTVKPTTKLTTNKPTTPKPTTTKLATTYQQSTTSIPLTLPVNQHATSPSDTNIGPPIDASPTVESRPGPKTRLTWTESPADQPKTTKKPGRDTCSKMV